MNDSVKAIIINIAELSSLFNIKYEPFALTSCFEFNNTEIEQ